MTPKVKVCGMTNVDDAMLAVELGADYIGLIFAESPRRISISAAKQIADKLKGKTQIVGVFADANDPSIADVIANVELDMLQLYFPVGANTALELPLPILRSYWIEKEDDLGSIDIGGALLDFKRVPHLLDKPMPSPLADELRTAFLAGGLDCDNVEAVLKAHQPMAVDVARGVESVPGRKDRDKLTDFIRKVKAWPNQTV